MNEIDELNIKRCKLNMRLGEIQTLKEFDAYITAQMKADINAKLDLESIDRNTSSLAEKSKSTELLAIKYKI